MKKWQSVLATLVISGTMISCSKSNRNVAEPTSGEAGLASKSFVNEGTNRLKELITDYSNTRFHYNREGRLDSVVEIVRGALYSRFIMFGKGKFTDSIHHYSGENLFHVYTDIKYNLQERMTEYTERRPTNRNAYTRFILKYDKQGDLVAQNMESNSRAIVENFYSYNNDHDLVGYDLVVEGLHHPYALRGDNYLNPFFQTDLFYIVFSDGEKQPLLLSKHNVTEVQFTPSGTTYKYVNEYDRLGRLIRKTSNRPGGHYSLTYY